MKVTGLRMRGMAMENKLFTMAHLLMELGTKVT